MNGQGAAATAKLLVVEDEDHLCRGLELNFQMDGYEVSTAKTLAAARAAVQNDPPSLIVLDLMLPDGPGLDLCRELRRRGDYTPILVLTAKGRPADVVNGLEEGADDYLTKPFELNELLSRVKVLLRRQQWLRAAYESATPTQVGEAVVDWDASEFRRGGQAHRLTGLEARLLKTFVENDGRTLTREALLRDVWGLTGYRTRTVDNFVARLRKYFEANPSDPKLFLTVRGRGYRYVGAETETAE